MRCIIVNGANLKAGAYCANCRNKIGNSYIREIGTRLLYCDFRCYCDAAEMPAAGLDPRRAGLLSAGTSNA